MRRTAVALGCVLVSVALGACDPASLYGPLKGQWTAQPSNSPIAATPAVGGGTVYLGSWDGNEYAFNEATGSVGWSANLGTTQADCGGTIYTQGVTSSPWLADGIAYLGGGGSTWDALDTATGNVLWTVPTGDNSITGGHYNWSSPLVYNGHAYVGIASFCDMPLVQGELLSVNLSTDQVDNVFKVVPDGQTGGGIWTNPVLDPTTNTLFVATGSSGSGSEPYAVSIVALDPTTLAVKSSWHLPPDPTPDADFATTPVPFTDANGRALLAVTNKNGMLYALPRDDLSAGPVWQTRIAEPTSACSSMCAGSFSNGLFDGTRLYYAAGLTTINGQSAGGSIRAIDPTTGAFVWEHALPAQVFGALASANGMIAVPSSDGGLYIIRAADGAVLYANTLTGASNASAIFAAPTIADGYLFIGTTSGVVHAFTWPAPPGAASAVRAGAAMAVRASSARSSPGATRCAAAGGSILRADCRLVIRGRPQCARLGELPAMVGAVALDRLTVRATGRRARFQATVEFYADGSCAGSPAIRVRMIEGHGAPRVGLPRTLPPGAVMSVRASRAVQLDVRMLGRQIREAAAPTVPPGVAARPVP